MPVTTAKTPSDNVIEHDGMLWKPQRAATSTAEEFIAARGIFKEINCDSRWNPWVRDDRKAEFERAIDVMDQWRRAEPGHRMLTPWQIELRWARQDKARERACTEESREREARKAQYDEDRWTARLALIENQSKLEHEISELAKYQDGPLFPKIVPKRGEELVAELVQSIERRRLEIDRLATVVGDPESIVNQNGWLPTECRDYMLLRYICSREQEVRRLRREIPKPVAPGKRKDRMPADVKRRRLDELLAVPPLTADDMCSECPTPLAEHGWGALPFQRPCPAWPGWGARLRRARKIFETTIRENPPLPAPPAPKPQPLAKIPSGLPIAEITKRLQELQTQFPDAEVRRGRANRWELWPKV
ncbi:hypothetical protein [Mycolicibacterium komossense]|uniref:Uncharacterized protein n=1 Tax=Mycolicibacterium komossense TaxID=1779 RepID=A0ABT3CHZ4_9MYCO|nr:hypothetical protein [Mycolicibacterium komossense]MCV7229085.1 hypothetical protein [Mycolicibacterium komossense]